MKRKILYYILIIPVIFFAGCELDNYDPPSSPLTGRLVYNGQPVEIRQGIDVLQLLQPGYENSNAIPIRVQQDGSFSSLLFDGTYQLIRVAGNGPWTHVPDTMEIEVRGATTVDVPITPFFSVADVDFTVTDGVLTASCRVTQHVDRQLEAVVLLVGRRALLDHMYRITESRIPGAQVTLDEQITLSQTLTTDQLASQPYLFARIGVKAVGHPEYIYSPVWEVPR